MLVFVEGSFLNGRVEVKVDRMQPLKFGHIITDVATTVSPPPCAIGPCVRLYIYIYIIYTHT